MSTRTENRPVAAPTGPAPRTRPDDPLPPQPDPTGRAPRLELSLAQVVGGSLAAATAAAAGSRLGVLGTISGAAVFSVVASIATAFYTTSLRHTGHHVSSVLRRREPGTRRPGARRLVAGAAVVFALAALVVTGVELVTGRSLDGSGGTTITRTVEGSTAGGSGASRSGPTGHDGTPTPSATTDPSATATPSGTPTGSVPPIASPSDPAPGSASPSSAPTGASSPTPSASPDPSASTPPTPSASAPPSEPPGSGGHTSDDVGPGQAVPDGLSR